MPYPLAFLPTVVKWGHVHHCDKGILSSGQKGGFFHSWEGEARSLDAGGKAGPSSWGQSRSSSRMTLLLGNKEIAGDIFFHKTNWALQWSKLRFCFLTAMGIGNLLVDHGIKVVIYQ